MAPLALDGTIVVYDQFILLHVDVNYILVVKVREISRCWYEVVEARSSYAATPVRWLIWLAVDLDNILEIKTSFLEVGLRSAPVCSREDGFRECADVVRGHHTLLRRFRSLWSWPSRRKRFNSKRTAMKFF